MTATAAPTPQPCRARLIVLATSDLHATLLPYDYAQDRPGLPQGLAAIATLVSRIRAAAPNSLLFDNGDTLQGGALGEAIAAEGLGEGAMHPIIAAMNHMGYDAMTLGNHDFDFGLAFLDRALADAAFPVVLSNTRRDPKLPPAPRSVVRTALRPREILCEDGRIAQLKIGVIGLLPPETLVWAHAQLAGQVRIAPMLDAARTAARDLRRDGADLVIALCHSDIGDGGAEAPGAAAAGAVAELAGVDLVIAGHGHRVETFLTEEGVPVVSPGADGSHLGRVALRLTLDGAGVRVDSAAASVLPVDSGAPPPLPAPEMVALAMPSHTRLLGQLRREVGTTPVPLSSHFALLRPTAAWRLVAAAQRRAVAPHVSGPILSAAAPFRAGGGPRAARNFTHIPAGPVLARHLVDLYGYPNQVAALALTGAEIRAWLARAAAIFPPLPPGQTAAELCDPARAAYDFEMIDGLSYAIDLQAPPGSPDRICDLRRGDVPLAPQDEVILATNSHRAGGAGDFPRGRPVPLPEIATRDALIAELAALAGQAPAGTPGAGWHLRARRGQTCRFATAAEARLDAPDAQGVVGRDLGLDLQGFRIFEIEMDSLGPARLAKPDRIP